MKNLFLMTLVSSLAFSVASPAEEMGKVKRKSLMVNLGGDEVRSRELMNLYGDSLTYTNRKAAIRYGSGTALFTPDGRTTSDEPGLQFLRTLSMYDMYRTYGIQEKQAQFKTEFELEGLIAPVSQRQFAYLQPVPFTLVKVPDLVANPEQMDMNAVATNIFARVAPLISENARSLPERGQYNDYRRDLLHDVHESMLNVLTTEYPYTMVPYDTDAGYAYSVLNNYQPVLVYDSMRIVPDSVIAQDPRRHSESRQTFVLPQIGELISYNRVKVSSMSADDGSPRPPLRPDIIVPRAPKDWTIQAIDRDLGSQAIKAAKGMLTFDRVKFGGRKYDRQKPAVVKVDLIKNFSKPDELEIQVQFGYLDLKSPWFPRASVNLEKDPDNKIAPVTPQGYENALQISGYLTAAPSAKVSLYVHQLAFRLFRKTPAALNWEEAQKNDPTFDGLEVIPGKTLLSFSLGGVVVADNQSGWIDPRWVSGAALRGQANPAINSKADLDQNSHQISMIIMSVLEQINKSQAMLGEVFKESDLTNILGK